MINLAAVLSRPSILDPEKFIDDGPYICGPPRVRFRVIFTEEERDFLSAATGRTLANHARLSPQQQTWLGHVRRQILSYPFDELGYLLRRFPPQDQTIRHEDFLLKEMFLLLRRVAVVVAQEPKSSIDNIIEVLSGDLPDGPAGLLRHQHRCFQKHARRLIFFCMSWTTMLYSTRFQRDVDNLYLDDFQCHSIDTSRPTESSDRPLCEMFQEFGSFLPVKEDDIVPTISDPVCPSTSLYVSLLNAATLSQIGGITIKWIDNIGSHLSFDPDTRVLLLFRLPSFCEVHARKTTIVSRILSEYYDESKKPRGFDTVALLREIRTSYGLIFSDDSASRALYNRQERKSLLKFGTIDPDLDELCGVSSRTGAGIERNSYNKESDFPVLGARLSRLQDYILRQNPKSLRMIWRDKRNPAQWYTFWAVIWIGGAGLVLSVCQTFLSALQVYYTVRDRKQIFG